jgi:hypothetical protein
VVPASGAEARADESQLKKQYFGAVDSNDAQTCAKPVRHSPGTAQQSASDWQVCEQYPF